MYGTPASMFLLLLFCFLITVGCYYGSGMGTSAQRKLSQKQRKCLKNAYKNKTTKKAIKINNDIAHHNNDVVLARVFLCRMHS